MKNKNLKLIMFYFFTYCKARKKGWNELIDTMLAAINNHGFDVKEINGKWCLVKLDEFENKGVENVDKE